MNDQTITIYNGKKNPANKNNYIYQRTVISGVSYAYKMEKVVDSSGTIKLTNALSVIIPDDADTGDRQYIDAIEYAKLADTSNYWTVDSTSNHDFIVCGKCTQEIDSTYKSSQLKQDYQKAGIVQGFSDNTDVSFLKHYKVVAT